MTARLRHARRPWRSPSTRQRPVPGSGGCPSPSARHTVAGGASRLARLRRNQASIRLLVSIGKQCNRRLATPANLPTGMLRGAAGSGGSHGVVGYWGCRLGQQRLPRGCSPWVIPLTAATTLEEVRSEASAEEGGPARAPRDASPPGAARRPVHPCRPSFLRRVRSSLQPWHSAEQKAVASPHGLIWIVVEECLQAIIAH
jgi:hypothetical protein